MEPENIPVEPQAEEAAPVVVSAEEVSTPSEVPSE